MVVLWLHTRTNHYILAKLQHDAFYVTFIVLPVEVFTGSFHLPKFILSSFSEFQSNKLLPPKQKAV